MKYQCSATTNFVVHNTRSKLSFNNIFNNARKNSRLIKKNIFIEYLNIPNTILTVSVINYKQKYLDEYNSITCT